MAEVGTGLSTNINESLGPLFLLDEAMSRPEAYQAKVDPPVLLTTAGNKAAAWVAPWGCAGPGLAARMDCQTVV